MVLLTFGAWRRWGRFRGEENFNKRVWFSRTRRVFKARGRADGTHDSDLAAVPLSSPLETLLRRCPWPRLPKDDGHRLYQHPRTGPVSIPSSVSRARFTSPSGGFSFPSTPGSANRLRRPSLLDERLSSYSLGITESQSPVRSPNRAKLSTAPSPVLISSRNRTVRIPEARSVSSMDILESSETTPVSSMGMP